MAERKSGPVKPPIIDLTARPAGAAKPAGSKPVAASAGPAASEAASAASKPANSAAAIVSPAVVEAKPIEGKPVDVSPVTPEPGPAPTELVPLPPAPPTLESPRAAVPPPPPPGAHRPPPPPPPPPGAHRPPPPPPPPPGAHRPPPPPPPPQHAGPHKPPAPPRPSIIAPAFYGAFAGAIIAIAVCYSLAASGYWPTTAADPTARLDQLAARLAAAEKANESGVGALADLNAGLGVLRADSSAGLAATSASLAAMQKTVGALQTAKPADTTPIVAAMKTLSARVDAVAAGASSADAGAIAANISALQQGMSDLGGKLTALDAKAGATDTAVAGLKAEIDAAKTSIDQAASAPSPQAIASAMQLPLLLSALEADFAAGRPYAADLATLTKAVPEARVPAAVADAAASGLPSSDDLAARIASAMPDMLAARPPGTDNSWQGQTMDWLRGMLALRPAGVATGNTPDALLSQLRVAISRRDFAAAGSLFDRLPDGVKQAGATLGAPIHALADATSFVAGLRTQALAPATEAKP